MIWREERELIYEENSAPFCVHGDCAVHAVTSTITLSLIFYARLWHVDPRFSAPFCVHKGSCIAIMIARTCRISIPIPDPFVFPGIVHMLSLK